MTAKKIIILSIIIGLILLTAAVFIKYAGFGVFQNWLNKNREQESVKIEEKKLPEKTTATSGVSIKKIDVGEINETKPEEKTDIKTDGLSEKDDLKRIAAAFAERFGSYSNQSNYSNINDLKIFMSQRMLDWAQDFIKQQKKNEPTEQYYGITTKAIGQEFLDFDETAGKAIILVITRRREAKAAIGNYSNQFNQNITINFIKEGGIWKVDSAVWGER